MRKNVNKNEGKYFFFGNFLLEKGGVCWQKAYGLVIAVCLVYMVYKIITHRSIVVLLRMSSKVVVVVRMVLIVVR